MNMKYECMKTSSNYVKLPNELAEAKLLSEKDLRHSLAECGKDIKVYQGCRIISPSFVKIGSYSQIDEAVFIFGGLGTSLGRYVHLAFHSSISGGGECDIEDFVSIGTGVKIITGTDIPAEDGLNNPTVPPRYRRVDRAKVCIRSHAIIFTNSIIFPGVTIGEGAVVSAGSLVHRNLKPWIVYGGNPLVALGNREKSEILKQASELIKSSNDQANP